MGPPMRPASGSKDILVSVVEGDEGISGVRRRQEGNAHYSDGSGLGPVDGYSFILFACLFVAPFLSLSLSLSRSRSRSLFHFFSAFFPLSLSHSHSRIAPGEKKKKGK